MGFFGLCVANDPPEPYNMSGSFGTERPRLDWLVPRPVEMD
jgi:hypothetical protein